MDQMDKKQNKTFSQLYMFICQLFFVLKFNNSSILIKVMFECYEKSIKVYIFIYTLI